jgi:broad specificity phosphatase PhoE
MAEERKGRRPTRIILVRHGESEGNVDSNTYCRVADSKIQLTEAGINAAKKCGDEIRALIEKDSSGRENPDWRVYFYVSPYQRTLGTLKGIGRAFAKQHILGVREEPRIREQDFGNFQQRERMKVVQDIRSRFGRFFYRFPEGESAADVFDRVTSMFTLSPPLGMNDEEKEKASVHSKDGFVILTVGVVAFPLLQVFWKVCGGILT